jgi:2,5-diketo-D-gluconate reductase A
MPVLGLGVWQMAAGAETERAVEYALDVGYRHIDTASMYRNEQSVGAAVRRSGVSREEIFVTTKLFPTHPSAERELEKSLKRLGFDYVDLYLIHWPQPRLNRFIDTWRALEKLYADGRTRAIGVSNFQVAHLQRLRDETDVVPALNQIELHPYLPQTELRAYHAEHGIATEAWSPLAKGGALLRDPVITTVAAKYGRTPAQVVLRWHIREGTVVIPKSVHADRIAENFDVFGFDLAADDMAAISELDRDGRTGPHPDRF